MRSITGCCLFRVEDLVIFPDDLKYRDVSTLVAMSDNDIGFIECSNRGDCEFF